MAAPSHSVEGLPGHESRGDNSAQDEHEKDLSFCKQSAPLQSRVQYQDLPHPTSPRHAILVNVQPLVTEFPSRQGDDRTDNKERTDDSHTGPGRIRRRDIIGIWGLSLLCFGPVLNLTALDILAFLWTGDSSNGPWQHVIVYE